MASTPSPNLPEDRFLTWANAVYEFRPKDEKIVSLAETGSEWYPACVAVTENAILHIREIREGPDQTIAYQIIVSAPLCQITRSNTDGKTLKVAVGQQHSIALRNSADATAILNKLKSAQDSHRQHCTGDVCRIELERKPPRPTPSTKIEPHSAGKTPSIPPVPTPVPVSLAKDARSTVPHQPNRRGLAVKVSGAAALVAAAIAAVLVLPKLTADPATAEPVTSARTDAGPVGSTSASATPVAISAPCGHNPTAPSSMPDDSLAQALDRVGATDQLVCALGEVQDNAGYGMDSRATTFAERAGLASVVISECENAANGYTTWSEITEEDVLDGAPRRGAVMFNTHLENAFCPALKFPTEPALPAAELTSEPMDENSMRGLYSSLDWIAGRFEKVSLSECTSRLGAFNKDGRAYHFDDHSVLCEDVYNPDRPVLHPTLAFLQPQPEDAALDSARELLPADAVEVDRTLGTSTIGTGTCLSVDYFSPALAAFQNTQSRAPSDPGYANIHLYSERQTSNGSSAKYTGTAKAAYVSASRDNDVADPVC